EPEAFEAELTEDVIADRLDGIAPVAMAPIAGGADTDPEASRPIDRVDLEDVHASNCPPVLEAADHEVDDALAGLCLVSLHPRPTYCEAHRPAAHERREFGILVPGLDQVDISRLDRPQVHELATNDRARGWGSRH